MAGFAREHQRDQNDGTKLARSARREDKAAKVGLELATIPQDR